MSRQQTLLLGIVVILVMLFLVGCGGPAVTPVSEAPTATSVPEQAATSTPESPEDTPTPQEPPPDTPTPEPPTATLTPKPPTTTPTPVPPTETPTPAVVNPQAGATFSGDLESSEATSSGTINFKLSDDGNSITEGEIKLTGEPLQPVECSGGSLEGMAELTQSLKGPFSIEAGNIDALLAEGGELKGTFTSPTEASGTFKIVIEITVFQTITCDFGLWNWSAKAK